MTRKTETRSLNWPPIPSSKCATQIPMPSSSPAKDTIRTTAAKVREKETMAAKARVKETTVVKARVKETTVVKVRVKENHRH